MQPLRSASFPPVPAPGSNPTIDAIVSTVRARIAAARWGPGEDPSDLVSPKAGQEEDGEPSGTEDDTPITVPDMVFPVMALSSAKAAGEAVASTAADPAPVQPAPAPSMGPSIRCLSSNGAH